MAWARLDDHFPTHPKVVAAGGDAAWLHVCALCYSAEHLTDGVIPKPVLSRLSDRKRPNVLAEKLVAVGMWIDRGDSFELHDYLAYNPSREHVLEERRKAAERRANGARASADSRATNRSASGDEQVPRPVPSRPESPSDSVGSANASPPAAKKSRGTRIPDPYSLSDKDLEWFDKKYPSRDGRWLEAETEKFVDHFRKAPGQKGVAMDWPAAWRNWIRRADEGFS